MQSRRNFITKSLFGLGAMTVATPTLLASAGEHHSISRKIKVQDSDIILFQGDSITDAGRNKENLQPNDSNALGSGYAMMAAGQLLDTHAAKNIKVYNRGISGNRIPDLLERWEKDTIALRPNILSILIGVNDFWRTKDSGAHNTPETFKKQYQQLLTQTIAKLPNVKLIICEPFGVKGVKHVTDDWYPDFPKYQQVTKDIAEEFGAIFLPYQQVFDKAIQRGSGDYWTTDGVHTSLAGANLMAASWLTLVK